MAQEWWERTLQEIDRKMKRATPSRSSEKNSRGMREGRKLNEVVEWWG